VALGGIIKLGEPEPALGKFIKVRRFDLTPITSDVRVTHIIDHDEDDIRPTSVRISAMKDRATNEGKNDKILEY
tara:strand:- start:138 stop:359 length:222 start_codon:yes stop_codon:yes gene_type:complete